MTWLCLYLALQSSWCYEYGAFSTSALMPSKLPHACFLHYCLPFELPAMCSSMRAGNLSHAVCMLLNLLPEPPICQVSKWSVLSGDICLSATLTVLVWIFRACCLCVGWLRNHTVFQTYLQRTLHTFYNYLILQPLAIKLLFLFQSQLFDISHICEHRILESYYFLLSMLLVSCFFNNVMQ